MLRDCRAVICLGSRVDFDEGVEGGDDVGEGVGGRGREGDDEVVMVVVEKRKRERMKRSGFMVKKHEHVFVVCEMKTNESRNVFEIEK